MCILYRHVYSYLLDIPRQPTCMKLGTRELYQPIQSCHVVCPGISNKSVAVPSIHPCRAVLSGHCNIYVCTVHICIKACEGLWVFDYVYTHTVQLSVHVQ